MEECGQCPVFASFTLAFALQLSKKHGKTSITLTSFSFSDISSDSTTSHAIGDEGSSLSDSPDASSPEALALLGIGVGKTKRINPLTYKGEPGRVKTPIRRGGSIHALMHGKGKGKKSGISTIFQTSVTALSFLAFGGYLLCLIVQAVRAKNASMAMTMNGAAVQSNASNVVFLGRRPSFGKRRKRDSTQEGNSTEYFQNKTLEETQSNAKFIRRHLIDEEVPKALANQYGKKRDIQSHITDGTNIAGMEATTSKLITGNHGSNDRQELSQGPEGDDEGKVETSDDDEYEEMDNTEDMQQARVFHKDEVEITHWPLANVDDMYRALVMISEGYSLYHQTFHMG